MTDRQTKAGGWGGGGTLKQVQSESRVGVGTAG